MSFQFDAIVQVPLAAGQHSQFNNFSEVQIQPILIVIPPPLPEPPHPEPFIFQQPVRPQPPAVRL